MYDRRIKIFIILIALLLLVCLLRLAQMQLRDDSFYRAEIAELKRQKGRSRQLKTARGKILDRKGRVLAVDEPRFQLCISYKLSRFADERLRRAELLGAAKKTDPNTASADVQKELETKLEHLRQIIDKCVHFGLERTYIENKIKKINDKIWNLRTFLAWRRNGANPDILEKYNNRIINVPGPVAIADFKKKYPDEDKRFLLISKVDDIAEMNKTCPLLELKTDDDIFTAQLEFMNVDGVQILPKGHRYYPYGPAAAQTIGWVGKPQKSDRELFAEDKLSSYLDDDEEVCGREDGVEYICEAILRGRRGEVFTDIDGRRINRAKTQFGRDVSLTLDIELQKKIEKYLANYDHDLNCGPGMAAVVIEVATGDILALVSIPVFDLNRIRYDYRDIVSNPNGPLRNRAINEQYPPGSVVKPLILIAGLETGKITPDEVISCPAKAAQKGWPNCWLYNRYGIGHDDKWRNNARNAIKGSCNIYFSRLAGRIDPLVLQKWLFKFGYGHISPLEARGTGTRDLRQTQGEISHINATGTVSDFNQVPLLKKTERRWFGIGQGNLRATPLQVASAMAAIARGGLYKPPRLFMNDESRESSNEHRASSIDINISPRTLDIIRDGMSAVVNEQGGTAYREFARADFAKQDIKVYGKTGSTERPDNAWFAGFAEDGKDRSIAIAVVVEGGQHGSRDAAPLASQIIQFCIDARYIGKISK